MKYGKLMDIVKSGTINIPLYIYKEYPKLKIDLETFIFLMYLYSKGNKIPFDIDLLSKEFFCDIKDIMTYIATLQENKLIEIKVIKNEKNIMEEYIYLDLFYEKISLCIVGEVNEEKKEEESDIFSLLAKELNKQLSSILRYIDKILYEWSKKGIKTKEDVEKNRVQYREKEKPKKLELFEYDWINEDE